VALALVPYLQLPAGQFFQFLLDLACDIVRIPLIIFFSQFI